MKEETKTTAENPIKNLKKNDTVVILGTAGTLSVTPWDLPDTDYWACQPVITYKQHEGHRIDALFEMHQMETWKQFAESLNLYNKDKTIPIFMIQANQQVNNSIAYPIREVQQMVADNMKLKKYFTSTISYMIAMAIWMGYKSIELYGVHMAADEERYSLQRSCCETWLNYGFGKGVNYYVPDESSIMHSTHMYGYEQQNGIYLKLMNRREMMNNGLANMKKELERLKSDCDQQQGAVLGLDQLMAEYKEG
jgi:hypothetical protein